VDRPTIRAKFDKSHDKLVAPGTWLNQEVLFDNSIKGYRLFLDFFHEKMVLVFGLVLSLALSFFSSFREQGRMRGLVLGLVLGLALSLA
jgi:hypothetical protein